MEENREQVSNNGNLKTRKYIYYILGVLEVLFAIRFILKLLGANPSSSFVSFIYSLTQLGLAPFTSIFRTAVAKGVETQAVLEPATIIGMIVYALVGWGIIRLIEISKKTKDTQRL
ncbi:MAG: YggT family protein [Clostridiaceae bacterium]|nr:YggT family protein [Clostridiaceae bacterium]